MPNSYRQGEHICVLYDTEEEQFAIAAQYLADGLRSGQRVLYGAPSRAALARFTVTLGKEGVDPRAETDRGALLQGTPAELHLAGGRFDSERMLRMLNEAIEKALSDGFSGLRTCGDMSWLLTKAPGWDGFLEYEALLNPFFLGVPACGMCLYDRRRFGPDLLDHGLATHSSVVVDGHHKLNPFYCPPPVAAKRIARPSDLNWKLGELTRREPIR